MTAAAARRSSVMWRSRTIASPTLVRTPRTPRARVDAHGKAVAPGFINMLAHPEESLLIDGRALSDLRQGVTLEVLGEDSMGPLTPRMKELDLQRQGDIHYPIDWTTLGEYLHR